MLSYLDGHRVEGLFYENSDNLDDGTSTSGTIDTKQDTNSDIFVSELGSRGMEGQSFVLNSNLFCVPQSRRRFWAVFLQTIGSTLLDFRQRSASDIFRTLRLLVQVCQRRPPSVEHLLLDDNDPAVSGELARRASFVRTSEPYSWSSEHSQFFAQLRLCLNTPSPSPGTSLSPWFKTLTPMQRSTLILHQHRMLAASGQAVTGQAVTAASGQAVTAASGQGSRIKFMVDVMPSAGRVSASTTNAGDASVIIAPCILPKQLLWLHREGSFQRLLIGEESMLLQGWPIGRVNCVGVSNALLQDLAGNAMSPPVLLAVMMATIFAVSWKCDEGEDGQDQTSNDDVERALSVFANCIK
jgi:site-specific DNA-cytosine methylase